MEKRFLSDGTPVEIIRTMINETGMKEVKIKPVDRDCFESGVNPWIPEYGLFKEDPTQSRQP